VLRWIAITIGLVACQPLEEAVVGDLTYRQGTLHAGRDGQVSLVFDVDPAHEAFLLTAEVTGGNLVHVSRLQDPQGRVVFDAQEEVVSDEWMATAAFLDPVVSLNWPILPTHAPLEEGRWEVALATTDGDAQFVSSDVDIHLLLKADSEPTPVLSVTLVYTGSTADDLVLVEASREAVAHWQELAQGWGLRVEVREATYPVADIRPPGDASATDVEAIAEASGIGNVNVILVDGEVGLGGIYGMAGDIPAPLVATPDSAVLISMDMARGPDAAFSSQEVRILGETMAHEVGHLLGLFHPVEIDLDAWDALDDTPRCERAQGCESQLGDNVMFPYPVCTWSACEPQENLTSGQLAVVRNYVGVR